jgi:hypothetical protein
MVGEAETISRAGRAYRSVGQYGRLQLFRDECDFVVRDGARLVAAATLSASGNTVLLAHGWTVEDHTQLHEVARDLFVAAIEAPHQGCSCFVLPVLEERPYRSEAMDGTAVVPISAGLLRLDVSCAGLGVFEQHAGGTRVSVVVPGSGTTRVVERLDCLEIWSPTRLQSAHDSVSPLDATQLLLAVRIGWRLTTERAATLRNVANRCARSVSAEGVRCLLVSRALQLDGSSTERVTNRSGPAPA